jgi:outer membrane protein OmpA-like peptidoglycan-associated protein/flagellar hook assembly protein FlgD
MKNKIVLLILLACFTIVNAQSQLQPGNSNINDLKSADNMTNPAASINGESAINDADNPAASAKKQRYTFDINLAGIVGMDYAINYNIDPNDLTIGLGRNYYGQLFNMGLSMPTKAGVFTLSGEYLYGNSHHFDYGHMGFLNFSYARDLTDEFLFGLGFNVGLGQSNDPAVPLWSFTIDAGFIHDVGDIGTIYDLKYGVALKDIGWGTLATEKKYMNLFTPEVNLSFTAVQKDNFKMGMKANLELPTFQNLRMGLGMSFGFSDTFRLDISSRIDIAELAGIYGFENAATYSSVIPSFGFIYRYKEKNIKEEDAETKDFNEFHVKAAAAPAGRNDLWAYALGFTVPIGVYDTFAPVIDINFDSIFNYEPEVEEKKESEQPKTEDRKEKNKTSFIVKKIKSKILATKKKSVVDGVRIYISPNNDGINDTLTVPFSITDKRFIKGYNFIIEDPHGNIVRKIVNKEQREENKSSADYFKLKTGIDIPEKFIWDGTSEAGTPAEDGLYYFYIEAWDDNGNLGRSRKVPFVVDATAPQLELEEPDSLAKIFSPNNDGNKDVVKIEQDGSKEDLWKVEIINKFLGTVLTMDLKNSEPETFIWGGTDDKGILLPDGIYTYRIFSKDRAGNYTEKVINNIIINTLNTPIKLAVSDKYMSPNGDGVKDEIIITPDVPVTEGIVEWSFDINDTSKKNIFSIKGENNVPEKILFNNETLEKMIPEGKYTAKLRVKYMSGNYPEALTPEFEVDNTPPQARISQENSIFSPDGDGNKDSNKFFHETSKENEWIAEILEKDSGKRILSFSYLSEPPAEFEWAGYLDDGARIEDGVYIYKIYSTDSAGNMGSSNELSFRIDTKETPVELRTALNAFSPNNDKTKDFVEIIPVLEVTDGIDKFILNIMDTEGNVVRELANSSTFKDKYVWDGFDNRGDSANDGEYYAELRVKYDKGNEEKAISRKVELDRIFPEIKLTADNILFSPDNDGNKDSLNISADSSEEDKWSAEILNSANKTVREFVWKGTVKDFKWDGRDNNGNSVKDGSYKLKISSKDSAGNYSEEKIEDIVIDTRDTKIFVTADKNNFSPNEDNKLDFIVLKTLVNVKDGIESWKLVIKDDRNKIYKTFTSEKGIPSKIVWKGEDDEGKITEGKYKAIFDVVYKKGNKPHSETEEILVDISKPTVGVKLAPVPFSPDNDGVDDTVGINFDFKDESGIKYWKMDIFDPKGRLFKRFEGLGDKVNKITWDGRSFNGDTVFSAEDYKYTMTVFDNVANVSVSQGVIPVDILVIKDGDRLKIQIANINFAPDSPLLVSVEDNKEIGNNNIRVLKRLAEILKKYDSYKITVEGHANAIKWYNPELKEKEETEELLPLSQARAETVRRLLISYGVKPERLSAIGMGGSHPLVDPAKEPEKWQKEQWKNRRVEFILEK